ncbi:NUDIX domain-containing protein [Horticoccus luteus]|uniref:NUDIX domain-containing protein n=1 Tax=Horticoccus luteus TaxID=2862869 RepID=A0A8F9TVC9_9BACT|nr:NUDIX domain-containing protein [Horticoccus luteus]QYM79949.1 NUDIX domain-containing protein [Horticoccus luteus]
MNEEYFDVVDESDRPLRRATRREVHAQGWRHRAVHVLAFNERGEVFLQKRSQRKDVSPGLWTVSCSGHVDAGEDYDTAVCRELGEELGWHVVSAPPKWLRMEPRLATGWEFSWIYRLRADGPFTLNENEIDRGEWLTREEISRRVVSRAGEFCPGFRWLWALVAPRWD